MRSFIFLVFIMVIVALLYAGSELGKADYEVGIKRNVGNITTVKWNSTEFTNKLNEDNTNNSINDVDLITQRLKNSIYKFVDFLGYAIMEAGKTAVEIGYRHPYYDYKYLFDLIRYVAYILLACAILTTIGSAIIPILAIIYLICFWCYITTKKGINYIKIRRHK